ncbi:MAG: hypothetical protein DI544_06240 [Sphingomonas taxi]|uniref:Nucleotidyltransferase family protein n=1 Tax=Sphingomonas taxi TaxID=1549858 RepID=A0A2W5QT18_9SPHN|nr:MAG: hypothetical protein DI544_06240 [Sphingomonas taxi]
MALAAALRAIATTMRGAADPWWIIGSAAVRLHGVDTDVADVDLLTSERDARRFCAGHGRQPIAPAASERFRSAVFGRFEDGAMPIEVMGALTVHGPNGWQPVRLRSRQPVPVADTRVFVPDRAELVEVLRLFGRSKDLHRATLLERRMAAP